MVELFLSFMRKVASKGEALYILGDLFEAWVGDDTIGMPFNKRIVDAIAACSASGVKTYLMVGNRDFLLGNEFIQATGMTMLEDPTTIELYGQRTLLMHGDSLCTKDVAYQSFRRMVRSPQWQSEFLAHPLEERLQLAARMRSQSEQAKGSKSEMIMDAVPEAVEAVFRGLGYPDMIHGHTHRPARHLHEVDGNTCVRWVLPNWEQHGGYLLCTPETWKMRRVEFTQTMTTMD